MILIPIMIMTLQIHDRPQSMFAVCTMTSHAPTSAVWESITGVANMVMNTVHTARKFPFLYVLADYLHKPLMLMVLSKKTQTFVLARQLLAICIMSYL